eukprot:COSAG05_NODE_2621_length_2830_cov_575.029293_1_plen_110_part_10
MALILLRVHASGMGTIHSPIKVKHRHFATVFDSEGSAQDPSLFFRHSDLVESLGQPLEDEDEGVRAAVWSGFETFDRALMHEGGEKIMRDGFRASIFRLFFVSLCVVLLA